MQVVHHLRNSSMVYLKAMNKANIEFSSDSLIMKVTEYYDVHGSDYEKMTSHYILGCTYRDMRNAPTALQNFYKATKYAEEDILSYRMLAYIYGQMAEIFDRQALIEDEIKELDMAYHYALLAGDSVNAIAIYNYKASAYMMTNKMTSAVAINEKAIRMYKKMNHNDYAAQISTDCILYYISRKKFSKAKACFDFYEKYSGYFQNGEIEKGREIYYYDKGLYYSCINQNDSASYYLRKCLLFKNDPNLAVAGYHGLSLLYQKIGNADSAAKYAILAYNANDSTYQINAADALLKQQTLYNYCKYQEEALESSKQTASLQRWLFVIFVTWTHFILIEITGVLEWLDFYGLYLIDVLADIRTVGSDDGGAGGGGCEATTGLLVYLAAADVSESIYTDPVTT
jgi:tetratricopeptide (TPR) repeat protein